MFSTIRFNWWAARAGRRTRACVRLRGYQSPWSSEAATRYSPLKEGHKEKRGRVSCGLLL